MHEFTHKKAILERLLMRCTTRTTGRVLVLEANKAELEKERQASHDLANRWFDLSEQDFNKYRAHSHTSTQSPVNHIISVEVSRSGKSNYYVCDVCSVFGSPASYLSRDLCEQHIFFEDTQMHRNATIEQIDSEINSKITKHTLEFKKDIQDFAKSKREQDWATIEKARLAEIKKERDSLPFVK
jgi:hypothetical protein